MWALLNLEVFSLENRLLAWARAGGRARFALAYLLLVLAPLVTLAAVFGRAGSVRAPAAVHGRWQLSATASEQPSPACAGWNALLHGASLTIVQSGPHLLLRLEGTSSLVGSGTIEGRQVRASFARPPALLGAGVGPAAAPRSLAGTLSAAGCKALEFTALRRDELAQAGR